MAWILPLVICLAYLSGLEVLCICVRCSVLRAVRASKNYNMQNSKKTHYCVFINIHAPTKDIASTQQASQRHVQKLEIAGKF
jgi:hypothetical protein